MTHTAGATDRGERVQEPSGRFDVRSADGTSIAVWVDGTGPPLVLVHGSLSDHSTFDRLVAELRDDMTTFSMDRRGFGASDDTAPYSIEREFDDVAAVVRAVTTRTGEPVALWGHSYGANCALGGAALAGDVHRLVLYEPSLGLGYPDGSIEAIEAAIATGDLEAATVAVLAGPLELGADEIDVLRASPRWPMLVAGGAAAARECRAEQDWSYRPGQFDSVSAPAVLLTGSESPGPLRAATDRAAAAIPHARIRVLEGHAHLAYRTDPALVASFVREAVSGTGTG